MIRKKKSLADVIESWQDDAQFQERITYWKTIPPRKAKTAPFPVEMDERLREVLQGRGIGQLYTHQATAFQAAYSGQHIVAVTPTASGKTLCYNLPVLQTIIEKPHARALYLFPTKALAQDQKSELQEIVGELGMDIKSDTYDGDTAPHVRQKIRKSGHIAITNPDMLHQAILPHHTKWISLFENLTYVVIDEVHIYRGVFGSHVANVLRRLQRICQYYGSNPLFICTSATIANPKEHAEQLTNRPMKLVDNNGAPAAKKHMLLYNPPVVHEQLQIRRSSLLETRKLSAQLLREGIQTIVFARSRVRVEVLLHYLQSLTKREFGTKSIQAYRGGYLPNERRAIERGLRSGDIIGVVSTNALELGVDIGQLSACIMIGYPGSVSSTWQQAGRAGRRQDESLVILVASSNPLDQYMMSHPQFIFERSPETARIHPDNLVILVDHLKCAAFELPFRAGEMFGATDVEDVLDFLVDEQVLHRQGNTWHWMHDSFPAHNVSLRSASQENIVIIDQTERANVNVIGEMDRFSALTLLHEEAIYLHQGKQYQVERLDYENKKAYVREVEVDYFTDANLAVQLKVLEEDTCTHVGPFQYAYGEVTVNAMATIFKKIKLETHENIGSGPIHLPEEELHTSAMWWSLPSECVDQFGEDRLEQGLLGIAHVLRHVAPLFVLCDVHDVYVYPQLKAIHNEQPTLFVYDRYPGGVGLSEQLYREFPSIITEAQRMINDCTCQSGCPSCVGVTEDIGQLVKPTALQLIAMFQREVNGHVTKGKITSL